MIRYLVFFALPLALLAGCAARQTKGTFTVELANAGTVPISAGLTKRAPGRVRPPLEEGWAAPEDVAMGAPQYAERRWGELVEPGRTCIIGPVEGRFPEGVLAVLRIYAGNPTINELLGYSRDDPDRVEVLVPNGHSRYIVRSERGRLIVTPR